jgi:ABC-type protease/lipase transport system fused ATPase/permease subunit
MLREPRRPEAPSERNVGGGVKRSVKLIFTIATYLTRVEAGLGAIASSAMAEQGRPTQLKQAWSQVYNGLVLVGVVSFFLNVLALTSPLYMFQVFDRVLASGRVETLVALSGIATFALLCLGGLEVIRTRTLARISSWLDRALSRSVLQASLGDTLAGRAVGAHGMSDLAQLRGFINSQGIFPIMDAPWTPVFVAVIWLLHPWLGILAVISAVVLFSFALTNELVTRTPLTDASRAGLAAQHGHETALRSRKGAPPSAPGQRSHRLDLWHV